MSCKKKKQWIHLKVFASFQNGRQLSQEVASLLSKTSQKLRASCLPSIGNLSKLRTILIGKNLLPERNKEFAPSNKEFEQILKALRVTPHEKGGNYFHGRIISLGGASMPLNTCKQQMTKSSSSSVQSELAFIVYLQNLWIIQSLLMSNKGLNQTAQTDITCLCMCCQLDTLGRFSTILYKGDNSVTLLSHTPSPF